MQNCVMPEEGYWWYSQLGRQGVELAFANEVDDYFSLVANIGLLQREGVLRERRVRRKSRNS